MKFMTESSKEGSYILNEQIRNLHGREMPAVFKLGPMDEGMLALCKRIYR